MTESLSCTSADTITEGATCIEEVESLIDMGDKLLKRNEQLSLLVEIVGATSLVHPSRISKNGSSGNLASSIFKSARKLVSHKEGHTQSTALPPEEGLAPEDRICNPYVVVTYKGEIIHTTTTLFQDNNPIWDVKTHSLFLFNVKPRDLIEFKEPLVLTACHDATAFGKVKIIGRTTIDASSLLSLCDAQRVEFELEHPDAEKAKKAKRLRAFARKNPGMHKSRNNSASRRGDKRSRFALENGSSIAQRDTNTASYSIINQQYTPNVHSRGKLALRFRMAHERDKTFIATIHRNYMKLKPVPNEAVLPSERDEAESMGEQVVNSVIFNLRRVGKVFQTSHDGIPRVKVKPGPDPGRPSRQTEFLSKDEMVKECMAPSTNWVVSGTGSNGKPSSALDVETTSAALGRVYLEVLSCQDLPNLDVGGAVGNYTDPFVCAIYEDAMVETNVIDDELSPLWMPWSQRAFSFNMKHPLSTLYLAVFDYDAVGEHDGIGRIAVNLQNFYPQTNYTLRYKLHPSSNVDDRSSFGTVVIRVRVEVFNPKAFAMAGLSEPPRFHVNVRKERSLSVARYTCYGAFEDNKFDLAVLRSYVNELFEYKALLGYGTSDGLSSLLFWRPQVQFCGFLIPLNSFCVFCAAVHVVEKPYLLPAFIFFAAAWILIASKNERKQHPSPWRRCKSFTHYCSMLFGTELSSITTNISQNEGAARAKKREEAWKHRRETDTQKRNREWELQEELTTIVNENIQTKTEGKAIDPLAAFLPILLRIQKKLSGICDWCRRTNSVLRWEEGLISFWITVYCLSIGVFLVIIPVGFVFQWICRIAVWAFLGPWMRAVDIFILKSGAKHDLDEEQLNRLRDSSLNDLAHRFQEQSKLARLHGEENKKLKSMMQVRFGDFTILVPRRNVARHFDYPLAESMACYDPDSEPDLDLNLARVKVRAGQQLRGSMIPVLNAEYDAFEEETTGHDVMLKLKGLYSVAGNREERRRFNQKEICSPSAEVQLKAETCAARGQHSAQPGVVQRPAKDIIDVVLPRNGNQPSRSYPTFKISDSLPKDFIITAVSTVAEGDEEFASFDERDNVGNSFDEPRGSDCSREPGDRHVPRNFGGEYDDYDQGIEIVTQEDNADDVNRSAVDQDEVSCSSYSPTYRASNFVDLMFLRK